MLAKLLASNQHQLVFNMLEVGARPAGGLPEPYCDLLDVFPSSRLAAIEIDPALCEKLNRDARRGMRFYACALGRTEERRPLYEAVHPMCTSLYEPDQRLAEVFGAFGSMRLERRTEIETVSLDTFVRDRALGALDFVKLDIQGAELDVLRGGERSLQNAVAIVCEVEFIPLYKGQPLYGDVAAHLQARGFMLHKFHGFGGRVMKPLALQGTAGRPVQIMWADAVFTREFLEPAKLSEDQLLKLAVLLDLYQSKDVAHYLLRHYDSARGTRLSEDYLDLVTAEGVWSRKSGQ